jgi:hypothetical protein
MWYRLEGGVHAGRSRRQVCDDSHDLSFHDLAFGRVRGTSLWGSRFGYRIGYCLCELVKESRQVYPTYDECYTCVCIRTREESTYCEKHRRVLPVGSNPLSLICRDYKSRHSGDGIAERNKSRYFSDPTKLYQYSPYFFPNSVSVVCDFSELPPFPVE